MAVLNLKDRFQKIMNIESLIYKKEINKSALIYAINEETRFLNNLTDEDVIRLLNVLCNSFGMKDEISLIDDINNIHSFNPLTERLNYILLLKSTCLSENNFATALFNATKKRILITNDIENQIREIFFFLLDKHIGTSDCMSEEYLKILNTARKNIKYKYQNRISKNIPIEKDFIYTNIYEDYIKTTIEVLLRKILSFTDEELSLDFVYAQIVLYQTMLRSILVLSDNYDYLIEFEELYNKLEPNNTIAKSMIKAAFISNYEDIKTIQKEKTYEK